MPRIPRRYQWASEACFHLMARGHNREPIFADDEDRRAFLGLVGRYQSRFRFRAYHYCRRLARVPRPRRAKMVTLC
jgi:hypothetical protein